jgi:hypothetical protein
VALNGPQKPVVVVEELDDKGGEPGSTTNDPLSSYSRRTLEPVLLPSLHQASGALSREDELQQAIQDMMVRRVVEELQQQMKRLSEQRLHDTLSGRTDGAEPNRRPSD